MTQLQADASSSDAEDEDSSTSATSETTTERETADLDDEEPRRTTITFYLSEVLRNRARAAYRVTSFTEQDSSWSHMLSKALLAEVERRERLHNVGKPFAGGAEPLTPGRPIGF